MGQIFKFPVIRKTEVEYEKLKEKTIAETMERIATLESTYFTTMLSVLFRQSLPHNPEDITKVMWWWSIEISHLLFHSLVTHQPVLAGELADGTRIDGSTLEGSEVFCLYYLSQDVGVPFVVDWEMQKMAPAALKNWLDLIKRRRNSKDRTDEYIRHLLWTAQSQGWLFTEARLPNLQQILNGDYIAPAVFILRNKELTLRLVIDYYNYRGHLIEHPDHIL